ncbi:ABC transporter permease [Halalkalibacterium halodurans]|uniref:ABC transporter permease n=1 Tax=Halalkalibacterium halodurans TaxID=86665 RepID=UPI002E1F9D2C|nr:ABC transporter permease [Halalkalibacterium halodurans]MED4085023.1 ABC transporter permease [Halalkalibacterium halodurans]MED4107111.1 ABC transporter permease [Halalkalibacterium halodurans]MED4108683.1 ABC transporter permease [Halalkalibacterium halodurans]MED4149578.1 ABC transporter permease [Halalkalibacterium halodurans]
MGSFIKKDLLLFWRDRKELITVLALPILLVIVLNFAFAGLFGGDQELNLDLTLAVVNEDDETGTIAQLQEKLIKEASFKETEVARLVEQVGDIQPIPLLFEYLSSEDLQDWLTVYELTEAEAVAKVKEGDADGILVIPDGFTVNSLYAALVGEPTASSLIYKVEMETSNSATLYQIIDGFLDHMNNHFALQQMGEVQEANAPEGGLEKIGVGEAFTLTQYFTISMSALFALFLAATVATKTGEEIRQKVFHRILLTDRKPILFLVGKIVSTAFLVWLQMMLVFVVSHILLDVFPDRTVTFWLGVIGSVTVLSLAIAGIATIFTSLLLRMTNLDAANGIFMLVIIVFGVVGGNFVPIYIMPNWLQQIGEWVPNGLFLMILTEWIQFEEVSSIFSPSLLLVGFFLTCTVLGVALYPKRGTV